MTVLAGRADGLRAMPMWRPLAVRDFRRLWTSEAVSLVGDQFHYVALAWLVLQLTGSGFALGAVLIASGVPRAIMLIPFGALADRVAPRLLIVTAHLVRGAIVAAMAVVVLGGAPSLPLLVVLTTVFGIADALFLPAQSAWVPRLVGGDRLAAANAVIQGTVQLTSLLGPPIAGLAVAAVGSGTALALDAVSFLVAAAIVASIGRGAVSAVGRTHEVPPDADPGPGSAQARTPARATFRAEVAEGVRYAIADPAIRAMLVVQLAVNVAFNGPISVGMPWLADLRFDAGPAGLGLLVAAWGAGALVGTVVAGNLRLARIGWPVTGLAASAAAGLALMGIAPSLPVAMGVLATMGVAIGIVNILALSWLQRRVRPDLLGRVMSLSLLMSFGATPISLGLAGFLIDIDAARMFLLAGGLVLVALALGLVLRLPRLMNEPLGDEAGGVHAEAASDLVGEPAP